MSDQSTQKLPLWQELHNKLIVKALNGEKQMLKNKKVFILILMGMLIAYTSGCSKNVVKTQSQPAGYPIASDVFTTLQRTVVPDAIPAGSEKILPYEISKYEENGYGSWHYGPGIASEKRLDLMPTTYSDSSVTNASRLLKFFAMTDIHISDEETPAQAIALGYKGGLSSGYSPVMMYTTQVLDAAVQTVNALNKKTPIDFGISLGDSINSSQYNELRWFIGILDGKNINPDSGIKDDPIPGPSNDYQDEFKAVGLDKSIPWYMTLGNHDHFWMGSTPVTPYIKETYVGDTILNMGNPFTDPLGADSRGYYMGSINGSTPNGDIIGAGLVKNFATAPRIVAADPDRHEDIRKEFMNQFFTTTSNPVGHGFTQANVDDDFACYSFEPKSDIPIKVIVLDDTQNENDANLKGYGHGSLDTKRYNWLVSELEKGQAEDKLMIISAHIPLDVEVPGDYMGWSSGADVTEDKLVSKLHEYSNLILWASGHRHLNTVTALKSPDASHPELGFWQVETASLRDFPQEFRTFEVVRNTDNTVSIITVDVDPAVKEGSLAELSRKYAVASQQIFKNKLEPMPTGSYNAELVKQLSPEMQAKLQNYGTPIDLTSEKLLQDKKMIDAAKAMQTESGYAADDYTVITLKKGTVIYGMMPGQSAWYTDKESMDKSGNSYKELYRGMQIAPHPTYGYRTKLASYEVLEDMDVAFGKCLINKTVKIADVEVTLGEGGYTQFVVPDFAKKLKLLETIDLNEGVGQ